MAQSKQSLAVNTLDNSPVRLPHVDSPRLRWAHVWAAVGHGSIVWDEV